MANDGESLDQFCASGGVKFHTSRLDVLGEVLAGPGAWD
jgi:hypothetical protein